METDIKALSRQILDEIWNQETDASGHGVITTDWSRSTLPSPGWTATGTHLGDLSGIPATCRDGKFQEAWSQWDALNKNKSPASGYRGQKRGTRFC